MQGQQVACSHCSSWFQYWVRGGEWEDEREGEGEGGGGVKGGTREEWMGMGELERLKWATRKLVRKGVRDRMSLVWRKEG